MGDTYGRAAMDYDFVTASPDSRWVGETVARRRQRRLSSPSLRAYLTPAFDAVAEEGGGVSGYSSSSSSGGLDLEFDASLLRYRRACFAATADLDSRVLRYSPQSAPPPLPQPMQSRMAYPMAEDAIWAHGGYHYGSKPEAGGRFTTTPVFHDFEGLSFASPRQTSVDHPTPARGATNSIKPPAELQEGATNSIKPPAEVQEGTVRGTKVELSTPKVEAKAVSEKPYPNEEEDDSKIIEALYGHSGKRRLPIFMQICPE
ncbi:hypothetical protein PR202_ga29091 [Eleusine coracana subsp. coracana]|uniref:Uncharacterized protein n=1 Tax=Eleusine coracana subsp. coracana TaxID=191504 RepID=A0AAV5DL99_ELECO|nr:hypothetical protein QOZ80_7AG0578280 [Eleusine coracana subsp. coracana]GJN10941.1 hypothetical protein PR202_ga29091 [Eleusine coracana subsp. coracana]